MTHGSESGYPIVSINCAPDAGPATSELALRVRSRCARCWGSAARSHAATNLQLSGIVVASCDLQGLVGAPPVCGWGRLSRETATDDRGSKPPPVFRLSGVIFGFAGARRSLPLCLVRAVWWPRRRIKLTAASSASAAAQAPPAAGAPLPPPRRRGVANVWTNTSHSAQSCAAPCRSSSAVST